MRVGKGKGEREGYVRVSARVRARVRVRAKVKGELPAHRHVISVRRGTRALAGREVPIASARPLDHRGVRALVDVAT